MGEALAAAMMLSRESERAASLISLTPHLPDALLPKALKAANSISGLLDGYWRARVLISLAPRLHERQREKVLRDVLTIARSLYYWQRAAALTALAPLYKDSGPILREAINAIKPHVRDSWYGTALATLVPHFQGPDRRTILLKALRAEEFYVKNEEDYSPGVTIAEIAPHLTKTMVIKALAIARAITYRTARKSKALTALAHRLPEASRVAVMLEALEAARDIPLKIGAAGHEYVVALASVAAHLPEKDRDAVFREAIEAARLQTDPNHALLLIAPLLSKEVIDEALAVAEFKKTSYNYALTLATLAARLPDRDRKEVLDEALSSARSLPADQNYWRVKALAALLPLSSNAAHQDLEREALISARAIERDDHRAESLAELWAARRSANDPDVNSGGSHTITAESRSGLGTSNVIPFRKPSRLIPALDYTRTIEFMPPLGDTIDMPPFKRTGDATLKAKLDQIEKEFGIDAVKVEYARRASASNGALDPGMVSAANYEVGTKIADEDRLSESAQREFSIYAKANRWISRSGISPTEHIRTHFGTWLAQGLMRKHIAAVQEDLADAYSAEIGRYPDRRISELGIEPRTTLSAAAPRSPSTRPVAALSEEEAAARRQARNEAQGRWRAKRRAQRIGAGPSG